jgi:hypothetical protein
MHRTERGSAGSTSRLEREKNDRPGATALGSVLCSVCIIDLKEELA